MVREQVLARVPQDMHKHLLRNKILDTAQLAAEAEEFASIIPNYWVKHANVRLRLLSSTLERKPHNPNEPNYMHTQQPAKYRIWQPKCKGTTLQPKSRLSAEA